MVRGKFDQINPVFISSDVEKTAKYYHDVFGFIVVDHCEYADKFAAIYRDKIEIIIVQAKKGKYLPNSQRYGAGYDLYIDAEKVDDVTLLYNKLKEKGAEIVVEPRLSSYGCYEFVVKDIDGRLIGIGRTKGKSFFKGMDIKQQ